MQIKNGMSQYRGGIGIHSGDGASVRVLLFDYRQAFDLIDHKILVNKLKQVNIPNSVINWVIDFLPGRSQRVKLGRDCL